MKIYDMRQFWIVVAMLFTPFTELRIGKIGVSEIILLILLVNLLINKLIKLKKNTSIFTRFWVIYIFFGFFGSFTNYVLYSKPSGILYNFLFDMFTYLFLLFVIYGLELYISSMKENNLYKILKNFYISSTIVMGILYVLSFLTPTLGPLRLKYYLFFSPMASNVHHTAMFLIPLPFIGMKLLFVEKKLIYIFLIIMNFVMALSTGSTKAIMGIVLGCFFLIWFLMKNFSRSKKYKVLFGLLTSIAIVLILFNKGSWILNKAIGFFVENDGSSARQILYKTALFKGLKSPIFGYGFGSHSSFFEDSFSDAHQTLLTIFLQTGILGVILFLKLIHKLYNECKKDSFFMAALIPIMIYILGGDVLRRLPIWIYFVLIYYEIKYRSYKK